MRVLERLISKIPQNFESSITEHKVELISLNLISEDNIKYITNIKEMAGK